MKQGNCPSCNKMNWVPEVAILHTESYGSGIKNCKCTQCGHVIKASFSVEVVIDWAETTDGESDWAE